MWSSFLILVSYLYLISFLKKSYVIFNLGFFCLAFPQSSFVVFIVSIACWVCKQSFSKQNLSLNVHNSFFHCFLNFIYFFQLLCNIQSSFPISPFRNCILALETINLFPMSSLHFLLVFNIKVATFHTKGKHDLTILVNDLGVVQVIEKCLCAMIGV